jgi:8-oxo-dGTP pyrophosphatase MutT (NUDIX family)
LAARFPGQPRPEISSIEQSPELFFFPSMIDIEFSLSDRLPANANISYPPHSPGIKSSAVLVPLLKDETVWKLLFTRRSNQLADHRGQVSFPGGHFETGDSGPLQTALRETCEEIGIRSEDIRPLGILDPADTRTGFRIWPVVCIMKWPFHLKLSLPEVREVFFVPVEWLMQGGNLTRRSMESINGGAQNAVPFFESFQGHVIWGATAAITVRLMEILREGWAS